jgi:hypothetical protein
VNVYPFDGLPCSHVADCDDVLALSWGSIVVEDCSCPRAIFKVRKS